MAKISRGKSYEAWAAERDRLADALSDAAQRYSDAMFAKIHAEKAAEEHNRYADSVEAWARGERFSKEGQLMAGFVTYKCERCGSSGISADGSCARCAEDSPDGRFNVLKIYDTV